MEFIGLGQTIDDERPVDLPLPNAFARLSVMTPRLELFLPWVLQDVPLLFSKMTYERDLNFNKSSWRGSEHYNGKIEVEALIIRVIREKDSDESKDVEEIRALCLSEFDVSACESRFTRSHFVPVADPTGKWIPGQFSQVMIWEVQVTDVTIERADHYSKEGHRIYQVHWLADFQSNPTRFKNHHSNKKQTLGVFQSKPDCLVWLDDEKSANTT